VVATIFSVGDSIYGLYDPFHYTYIAAFLKPIYLVFSIRVLRVYIYRYALVIKDSTPMVIFIVLYILYFSSMGQRLFAGTLEGVLYFPNFTSSVFNMLVLLTTSNYPDIMLPAYQRWRPSCIFFIFYLIIGLFLIMNLLLAIFYSNFKIRFRQKVENNNEKRSEYLLKEFIKYGGKQKGYLNKDEMYTFFLVIHNLVILKLEDVTPVTMQALDQTQRDKSFKQTSFLQVFDGAAGRKSATGAGRGLMQTTMRFAGGKRDIMPTQFDYIHKNKIAPFLEDPEKFYFHDMNILLTAYEFYKYENKNKQVFKSIDEDWTSPDGRAETFANSDENVASSRENSFQFKGRLS